MAIWRSRGKAPAEPNARLRTIGRATAPGRSPGISVPADRRSRRHRARRIRTAPPRSPRRPARWRLGHRGARHRAARGRCLSMTLRSRSRSWAVIFMRGRGVAGRAPWDRARGSTPRLPARSPNRSHAPACSTLLAAAMAMAPPEPPSPMTSGDARAPAAGARQEVDRAMASAWPRSSASDARIGAGGVDQASAAGRPKRSASSMRRTALR
jgi:hypothetical protein